MISNPLRLGFGLLLAAAVGRGFLATESSAVECAKSHTFLAPIDSSEHRKYAPDRQIDILHLLLNVTPDFSQRAVSGQATLRFKPIAKPLPELRLDAVDLAVSAVSASEKIASYHATGEAVVVTFEQPIPANREASVTITYSAQPVRGLYFRTPEMGYKPGDTHLFTQGEPIEARHWYPCYDAPNEKFTSEILCHVPEGMVALSNGRKLSEERNPTNGLVTFRWLQDKPHVNYLISLVAGYFKKIEDRYKDIPMAFHTPPSDINEAINSFKDTKAMMAYFEQEIGVPYPWAKYDQVVVHDFVAGGMENTSITTLTQDTLHTAASENIRSSEGLVAHELAHQWFGDLVTCKDWSHLWLNEGFATYYAHLFAGHKHGRDQLLFGLYNDARGILAHPNDTNSIVRRTYDSPSEQFNYLAYPKGSWVLHMLRSQLGEELFRQCIKTFLERHQYNTVVTEDLNAVVEELSGRSHDQFFDQWVYHAHHPELEISYNWDARAKQAKVSIAQNQKLSERVLLFRFPLKVRFKGQSGVADREIVVREKAEDFYFSLAEAPDVVRIDPDYTLLAKINFRVPEAMLRAQLADRSDVVGRLLAIEQLAAKKDHGAVAALKETLKNDPFYGVRIEAAKALRAIHTDEAFAALSDSLEQTNAIVRQQVLVAISGFYSEAAQAIVQRALAGEKNPDILASAIRALAPHNKPEVRTQLASYLRSDSYRNVLAQAAITAMRSQNDTSHIAPLQSALRERQSSFTSRGLAESLEALAYLARHEENKAEVREFLIPFTQDKRRPVRLGSINALGTLGDPRAIPVLETFAGAGKQNPEQPAAERAIARIRESRRPTDDLKDLRDEVLQLKRDNRELRKDLEEIKKRLDASKSTPQAPAARSRPRSGAKSRP